MPHMYAIKKVKMTSYTLFNTIIINTINTINMITKSYIFYCSRSKLRLNIYQLQTRLKSAYETYEFNAIKNNDSENFNRKWNPFISLFLN